ncbi:MAG: phenylalanine--tRNA ligase subunit alpha [Rickettsiaceae bacterium]|nr:phenylalanine--tRNA ligase subunit alpha [Rickettsiaceae bacterium]
MKESILKDAIYKINNSNSSVELENIRIEFTGKKGVISEEMRKMATMTIEDKKEFGKIINDIRLKFEQELNRKKNELIEKEFEDLLSKEQVDITLASRPKSIGSVHPVMQARAEIIEIFAHLGFEVKEGPSIETDWNNFTALNIDENHPARQMHDTFYMKESDDLVLRTHTSPVQIRTMKSNNPPMKFIAPGRTYRSDFDQTHTPMFHQIELLEISKEATMAKLKSLIEYFISCFFENTGPEVRFRPSYFPFTTPSAEVDIRFKGGKWLEILGCGMIHPKVLTNVGIDSNLHQGYAAGLGIERMAMLKYGIKDLRQFFDSDLRWLKHYNFSPFDVPSVTWGLTR